MSNEQILTKAIEKAIANGFEPIGEPSEIADQCLNKLGGWQLRNLIFDPYFAKALWGEELHSYVFDPPVDVTPGDVYLVEPVPEWQYRLQQMVIADDPIAYLGEHLD